jgi:malate synthase
MEDAATAEIARSQIWQWIHHERGVLDDGRKVTLELYKAILGEELSKLTAQAGSSLPYAKAAELLTKLVSSKGFTEFLTLPGYELIG